MGGTQRNEGVPVVRQKKGLVAFGLPGGSADHDSVLGTVVVHLPTVK